MRERIKGLRNLLELNNETMIIYPKEKKFFTYFDIQETKPSSEHRPHGIKYSLTLHDRTLQPNETRIFGIDNAHSVKAKGNIYIARKVTWDHVHKNDQILNYEFVDAEQLLIDFWQSVKTILAAYNILIA